jgi:hypothetical protein
MKRKLSLLSSALIGIIFGVLSNYSILFGSWVNLVVWAVVGLLIGLFIEDKIFIKWAGIFYGFFLTSSFLISGFQGSSNKIIGFSVLSIAISVVGAFCGWFIVFLGNWIKGRF